MDFSMNVFSQNASRRGFRMVRGINLETPGINVPLPHRGSQNVIAACEEQFWLLHARTIAAHRYIDPAGRQSLVPEQVGRAFVYGCAQAPNGQADVVVHALKRHTSWEVPTEPSMRMFKVSVRVGFDVLDQLQRVVKFVKWPTVSPLDLSGYNETSHYGPSYPTSLQALKMQERFFAQAPQWVRDFTNL